MNGIFAYAKLLIEFCSFLSGDHTIKSLISSLILTLLFSLSSVASESVDIRKLMTAYEFQESGLDSLNKEQLEVLNQWLISYTANEAPILKKKSSEVKEAEKASIRSQLVGDFEGWTGKTKFVLTNGQIWQQRAVETWRSPKIQAPNVEVRKNFLGFYEMEIEGVKRSVRVRRIK
ncbi:MAG: hypothetical protein AB8B81_02885 [Halioglobus sp.]